MTKLLTIAVLLLIHAIGATATPIMWTLEDLQFSCGAVTGSFVYDADLSPGYSNEAGVIISGSLATPDGLSYTEPFGFFTATQPHFIFSTPTDCVILTGTSWLWIDTDYTYLTDSGGMVPISKAHEQLCLSPDASVIATTFSGELVAQSSAPEPSAALLGGCALLAIYGFVLRKQKGYSVKVRSIKEFANRWRRAKRRISGFSPGSRSRRSNRSGRVLPSTLTSMKSSACGESSTRQEQHNPTLGAATLILHPASEVNSSIATT